MLRELFGSQNGLQSFTLYSRLGVEPEVILDFIDHYSSSGIVATTSGGAKIELTEKGREECPAEIRRLEQEAEADRGQFLLSLLKTPINRYAPYVPLPYANEWMRQDDSKQVLVGTAGGA